jgi:hypothetical protein
MRTRTLVACVAAALAVSTTALTAQDKPAEPEKPKAAEAKPRGEARVRNHVEQIVELKNRELLGEMQKLAQAGYGISAFRSDELGILVLGGPPEAVAEAVDAIRRFDVPRAKRPDRTEAKINTNAEITGWLLLARNEGGGGSPVPAALTPVVAQLKEHTVYKSYELLETMSLRVRNDYSGEVSGILPSLTSGLAARTFYRLELNGIHINSGDGTGPAVINFGRVQLNVEVGLPMTGADIDKSPVQYKTLEIKTGIDMREGQKAVVGKTTLDGTSGSLILVLTAKVIE